VLKEKCLNNEELKKEIAALELKVQQVPKVAAATTKKVQEKENKNPLPGSSHASAMEIEKAHFQEHIKAKNEKKAETYQNCKKTANATINPYVTQKPLLSKNSEFDEIGQKDGILNKLQEQLMKCASNNSRRPSSRCDIKRNDVKGSKSVLNCEAKTNLRSHSHSKKFLIKENRRARE
jgi:hypothetical protein